MKQNCTETSTRTIYKIRVQITILSECRCSFAIHWQKSPRRKLSYRWICWFFQYYFFVFYYYYFSRITHTFKSFLFLLFYKWCRFRYFVFILIIKLFWEVKWSLGVVAKFYWIFKEFVLFLKLFSPLKVFFFISTL